MRQSAHLVERSGQCLLPSFLTESYSLGDYEFDVRADELEEGAQQRLGVFLRPVR